MARFLLWPDCEVPLIALSTYLRKSEIVFLEPFGVLNSKFSLFLLSREEISVDEAFRSQKTNVPFDYAALRPENKPILISVHVCGCVSKQSVLRFRRKIRKGQKEPPRGSKGVLTSRRTWPNRLSIRPACSQIM